MLTLEEIEKELAGEVTRNRGKKLRMKKSRILKGLAGKANSRPVRITGLELIKRTELAYNPDYPFYFCGELERIHELRDREIARGGILKYVRIDWSETDKPRGGYFHPASYGWIGWAVFRGNFVTFDGRRKRVDGRYIHIQIED